MNIKTIIFISEMKNPFINATSTQIMTRNLLEGFKDNCDHLIFVPILQNMDESDIIIDYYKKMCDLIIPYKDITKNRDKRIFGKFSMILNTFIKKKFYIPAELKKYLNNDSVVVSHSPSIDSALLSRYIKKIYPKINYIQYRGDPITLSLITPETVPNKRMILKFVEENLHKCADKIVYGTESLYNSQIKLFPNDKSKSISSKVSFNSESESRYKNEQKTNTFGYYGNYYSSIRDIRPLYDAFRNIKSYNLTICGKGDIKLQSSENINILKRVPQSKIARLEKKSDVIICLLNRVGIQIPGKVFYQINTNKPIIVILDGPYKNEIKKELKKTSRFIFCENNVDSIIQALIHADNELKKNRNYFVDDYSPSEVCKEILYKNIE